MHTLAHFLEATINVRYGVMDRLSDGQTLLGNWLSALQVKCSSCINKCMSRGKVAEWKIQY